ncbi:hypothetical protein [Streptomyces sp. NPDC001978]|uniref:hypothetical protein n=1 Tax=Streptomyces sp. NPDC001978 TaxID=3364627 RepID=UPI0036C102FD
MVGLGGVGQDTATVLTKAAHQTYPYSKTTRGNIPVTINTTADGPAPRQALADTAI